MNSLKSKRFLLIGGVIAVLLLLASAAFATSTITYTGTIASGPQYDLYAVDLVAGNIVTGSVYCAPPPNNTLDSILSVYFPGSDSSSTSNADVYNDDGGPDICGGFRDSTLTFVAPVTGSYTFRVDGFGSATGDYTLVIQVEPGGNPMAADGRINPQQAAPVIIYCDASTIIGYNVEGASVFSIENGGTASGGWGSIAPTADGRMQLASSFPDGKPYALIFDGCPHGSYTAYSGDPGEQFDAGGY